MSIDKDLLDRLMEGRSPADLFGKIGILAELTKALAERALSTEMDVHLDEERAEEAPARAVDEQVQWARRATVGDIGGEGLLTAGQGAEVRHRPVETNRPHQAFDEACRLTKRHAKQHLRLKAGLDSVIAVGSLAATPACRCGVPGHGGIQPDGQLAPALERFIVSWPIPGLVARGSGAAHAAQLPRWIHEMNPSRDLYKRAYRPVSALPTASAVAFQAMCCALQGILQTLL